MFVLTYYIYLFVCSQCAPETQVAVVKKNLCFNHTCPKGEKCYVIGGRCRPGQMCLMIISTPICASPDPCSTTICNPGFKCVNVQYGSGPPYPRCQIVKTPCNYLTCPDPGQQCYVKNTKCKSVQTVITPVSYTHLDVYKRQCVLCVACN